MKRLAILSTHPIQYNAPLFRMIAADPDIELKVFYSKVTEEVRFDKDFGQEVTWDIPLTEGYAHESFAASESAGLQALIAGIEGFAADAVLVFGWNFAGHFAVMKHFKGNVPVWFRGDSTLIDPLPLWKRLARKLWLSYVYSHVDKAFYVGKANYRYYLWCGLQESQLIYAPHAVDNEFFGSEDNVKQALAKEQRKKLGIRHSDIVFLFVGKIDPIKQPLILVEAFLELTNCSKEYSHMSHLIFVGSGSMEKHLRQQFVASSNVHFVGFQNQSAMPMWYRVANIICLPSLSETWGLTINEALVCGCKALVSDRVGCAEDLVCNKAYGATFKWNDKNSLVESMETLLRTTSKANATDIPSIKDIYHSISKELTKQRSHKIKMN